MTEEMPYGTVHLVNALADDLLVVNSARVSFGRESTELTEADKGLINFLMRNRHGTPFEHNCFIFKVEAPIFVAREWFRHRIGSFNEYSGRYSEMTERAYLPSGDAVRTQVGKPGAYKFEGVDVTTSEQALSIIAEANKEAYDAYRTLLGLGVAKELARTVIPVGAFTEFFWTVNARSLMNFLSLRTHQDAQYEIRQLAVEVEQIFSQLMPVTYKAWVNAGKVAP